MKQTILPLLVAAISASTCAQQPKAPQPPPSSSVAIRPLWTLTPEKLLAPLPGDFNALCVGSDPNGNLLFQIDDAAETSRGPIFVLVEPKTGKPIRVFRTAAKPKDTVEWTSQTKWLPDGRFLQVAVTRGSLKDEEKEMPQGKVNVGVKLRILNTTKGTVSERLFPFDDPSAEGMSKGFCSWAGQRCVESKLWDKRLLVSNLYFVAELDPTTLKTTRFTLPPDVAGFKPPGDYLIKNGRLWEIQREGGSKYFVTEFDKPPREISVEEMNRIVKEQKIEEIAHPKTNEAKFLAREDEKGKEFTGRGGELIRHEGEKLFITPKGLKTMEVDLGASSSDSTVGLKKVGNLFLIDINISDDIRACPGVITVEPVR